MSSRTNRSTPATRVTPIVASHPPPPMSGFMRSRQAGAVGSRDFVAAPASSVAVMRCSLRGRRLRCGGRLLAVRRVRVLVADGRIHVVGEGAVAGLPLMDVDEGRL